MSEKAASDKEVPVEEYIINLLQTSTCLSMRKKYAVLVIPQLN